MKLKFRENIQKSLINHLKNIYDFDKMVQMAYSENFRKKYFQMLHGTF